MVQSVRETKTGGVAYTFSRSWWEVVEAKLTPTIEAIANADACLEGKARRIDFYRSGGKLVGFADPVLGIKILGSSELSKGAERDANESSRNRLSADANKSSRNRPSPDTSFPTVGDTWDDALPKLNALGRRDDLIRLTADSFADVRAGHRFIFARPSAPELGPYRIIQISVGPNIKDSASATLVDSDPFKLPPGLRPQSFRVGEQIRQPTKTKHVAPIYPPIAQFARVQGVVIIEATIGSDGKVQGAKVLRSVPLLDQAALDAVKQWEFTPTVLDGVRVPVIMTVTVQFTLS
jgi:protein TonB